MLRLLLLSCLAAVAVGGAPLRGPVAASLLEVKDGPGELDPYRVHPAYLRDPSKQISWCEVCSEVAYKVSQGVQPSCSKDYTLGQFTPDVCPQVIDIFLLYAHKMMYWTLYGCPKLDTWNGKRKTVIPCPANVMCSQLANTQLNRNYPMCAPDGRYDLSQSSQQNPAPSMLSPFNPNDPAFPRPYSAEERSRLSEAYGETPLGYPKYLTRKRRAHLDMAVGPNAVAMGQEAMAAPEVVTKSIAFDKDGIPHVKPAQPADMATANEAS